MSQGCMLKHHVIVTGKDHSNYMSIKSRNIDVEHKGFGVEENIRPLMEMESIIEYL